jgi:uncharacterized protein (DUF1810 family)
VNDLQRFVTAQDPMYTQVLAELRAGRKSSHWMWFIFPQLVGLGRSSTAQIYGLDGVEEAGRYLEHPVLGARLRECAAVVANTTHRTAEEIFGGIDAVKLRSSMTLFTHADPCEPVFKQVLDRCFRGHEDPLTVRMLAATHN